MKEFIKKHKKIKRVVKIIINIVMLPVLIPTGMVMNIRKILLTPKSRQTGAMGVLGRGISLIEIGRLNFLDDFIIVNTTFQELNRNPVRSLLRRKRIIHLVNVEECVLPFWYLLKYKVYKYLISRLRPDGSNVEIRSPRKKYVTERFGFKTDFLPDEMAPYLKEVPNTGLIAIVYAAIVLQKKDIYVIGIDFYQADYLTKSLKSQLEKEPDLSTDMSDKMMHFITSFMAKCPGTNFHFITASSFKCSLPNVKVYNIKP